MKRNLHRQRGVGLVTAILIIVGIASLAAAMVSITNYQNVSSGMDVQGARAYQAAKAGAEWGVYQAKRNGACAASASFFLPGDMSNFAATVTCNAYSVTMSSGAVVTRYRVVSTACSPTPGSCPNVTTDSNYVQRVIDVRFGG